MLAKRLHVAVAVITNNDGRILISQRAKNAHQGGLWEFPGGKVEQGENTLGALQRELQEELGITFSVASPLIKIQYQYPDLLVLLDVLSVDTFKGTPVGLESQPIQWVLPTELEDYSFPAGNNAIIKAIKLPNYYPIVDDSQGAELNMLLQLDKLISAGYTMIQLRAKHLEYSNFIDLAEQAIERSKKAEVRLFINTSLKTARLLGAEGVHLSAHHLKELSAHVKDSSIKVAVSCHTEKELFKAMEIGADFAVLSPVLKTKTHSNAVGLGWEGFTELVEQAGLPVYALGGVGPSTVAKAIESGAQGVAGIRAFKC